MVNREFCAFCAMGGVMKTVFALAALAAMGFAGVAYAGDATAPKVMSDSEMDKVTAGAVTVPGEGRITVGGFATLTAQEHGADGGAIVGQAGRSNAGDFATLTAQEHGAGNPNSGTRVGIGKCTAGQAVC